MSLRPKTLSIEEAEALALQGLTFLASDSQRLVRFLSLTGLTPQALKSFAVDRSLQAAIVDYLLSDESLLLVFTSEAQIDPQALAPAYEVLSRAAGQSGRHMS